jgi:hypothetical protein
MPTAITVSDYNVELRDKNGDLKAYLTPFVSNISWEWNRIGGCGRCSITINKAYRDIIFNARDDIQIRVKSGTTSKLVYRGYIANIVPTLKINQDIALDIRGYFDLLKKIIVHTSGDTRTYTSKTVAFIVDDIADTFIVAKTPITIAGALTAGDFTADTLEFLCTVEDALRTLSNLQGDIEYGVDEDLVFYWQTESTTINAKFFVGDNVSILERRVKWDDLVNKLYMIGGDVAGTKYRKTAEATDSQAQYYLAEEVINNSSIVTDSVAAQYMGAILTEMAIPQFSIRAQIKNTDLRLEDTIPMGMVTFYDAVYDNVSLGDTIGDIIGESFGGIKTVAIKAGGSGYTPGAQVLTVVQAGGADGTINVTVSAGGIVTAIVSVATQGTGYTTTGVGGTGANGLATTGGGGTGCTLNITALNITPYAGNNIVIGETAEGGSNIYVGAQYSAQVDRLSYSLSNTPGRFNIEIQLGDTVLETAAKIKRLELALANLNQSD